MAAPAVAEVAASGGMRALAGRVGQFFVKSAPAVGGAAAGVAWNVAMAPFVATKWLALGGLAYGGYKVAEKMFSSDKDEDATPSYASPPNPYMNTMDPQWGGGIPMGMQPTSYNLAGAGVNAPQMQVATTPPPQSMQWQNYVHNRAPSGGYAMTV